MKQAGWIVLALLVVLAAARFDFHSLAQSMGQVSLPAFAVLLGLQVVTQLLLNYQWCRIGKAIGGRHDFWPMLYVNARGAVVDAVTPGVKVGGEVIRGMLLTKELGYTPQEAAVLVTIQKMMSLFCFFLVNLAAFMHISRQMEDVWGGALQVVVYAVLLGFIGFIAALFLFTAQLEEKAACLRPTRRLTQALHGYLTELLASVRHLKGTRGELGKQFLLASAIWLLYPAKLILLAGLLGVQHHPVFLGEITFIAYMVGMIPLLPGGLGGFEATMTGFLAALGIEAHQALAVTLLFRFITFWFVMILSLGYMGIWKLRSETG